MAIIKYRKDANSPWQHLVPMEDGEYKERVLALEARCAALEWLVMDTSRLSLGLSEDGTYYLVYGIGEETSRDIIIPKSFRGKPVKEIEGATFVEVGLTSVKIPATVEIIGGYAFEGNPDCTFYVEACAKPSGWADSWNAASGPVVWGDHATNSNGFCERCDSFDDTYYTEGLAFETNYAETAYMATQGTCTAADVIIPSLYNNMPVQSVRDDGFCGNKVIESIKIACSVIGWDAFNGCTNLKKVIIGNGVHEVWSSAFYGCTSLAAVYYCGTPEEWGSISFSDGNDALKNATRYYYSETEPTGEGNYWHYNMDGSVAVW